MQSQPTLTPNTLAFMGLCNEYCNACEQAAEMEQSEFVATMLRLLPRLYITASDLSTDDEYLDEAYMNSAMDEDYYDAIRRNIEAVMGADDTYLEVFEQDMKYSDTPIACSIAESLADLMQELYNFLDTVRDATDETIQCAIGAVKENFNEYWGQTLCNVMRPLNQLKSTTLNHSDNEPYN